MLGKNVEKLEPLCTNGGNIKWCSTCGKGHDNSKKKPQLPLKPRNFISGYIPTRRQEAKEQICAHTCS